MIQDKANNSQYIYSQDGTRDVQEEPQILDEIVIEELSIDGICGVY